MPPDVTQARSLHRKLAEVMAEVGYIPKNGTAPAAMGGFKFAQFGDIADKVREALAKRKVTILPEQMDLISEHTEETKSGGTMFFQSWRVTWRLVDGESGETATLQSVGEGSDTHDKGAPKAQTNAAKYALLMAFLIPTGDDPEQDAHDEVKRQARPAAAPAPQPAAQTAHEQAIDDDFASLIAVAQGGPVPQASAPAPAPADGEPPRCPVHHWTMKPGKKGGWYCTGKTNGEWCKERVA